MELYKVLDENGHSQNGGDWQWSLPTLQEDGMWQAGDWHNVNGELVACKNGIHLCQKQDIYRWVKTGSTLYLTEHAAEETIIEEHKVVVRRARLLRPQVHEQWWLDVGVFVASIKTVPFFKAVESEKPEWKIFETRDAAWDVAGAVAGDAAWDVAGAVAGAAAREFARDVAWDVAWDVAREFARDVAWDVAEDGAREFARDVAGAVAWDVARDARLKAYSIVAGEHLEQKHREHIDARWEVWQRGYGLVCDVNGVLYVYKKP